MKKEDLIKAMQAGYSGEGSALVIEDLALPTGLYTEDEVDINDPDTIPFDVGFVHKGKRLYYKKSEGRVKTYSDK